MLAEKISVCSTNQVAGKMGVTVAYGTALEMNNPYDAGAEERGARQVEARLDRRECDVSMLEGDLRVP